MWLAITRKFQNCAAIVWLIHNIFYVSIMGMNLGQIGCVAKTREQINWRILQKISGELCGIIDSLDLDRKSK